MNRKRKKAGRLTVIAAGILFFITFYPFFLLVCGSFKDKIQLIENPWFFELPMYFENYAVAAKQIIGPICNSIIITATGILLTLAFSGLAAYAIVYSNMPGKNIIYFYIIALLMVPGFAILIPQFIVVRDMGLYNTYLGQVFPMVANDTAMGTMLMCTFFKAIPSSVVEAAQIEGCGKMRLFLKMVIPLSKPIIATVSIMTGLAIWNNYLWPLIVTTGNKVAPVIVAITKITADIKLGDGPAYAAYVIAAMPILILFALASKQFVEGMTAGAVKG